MLTSLDDVAKARRSAAFSPAPAGVFCPRPDLYQRKIPDIAEQFTVRIETVDQSDNSVTFSEQSYDMKHKIVSFRFAPRSHESPSVFFSRFVFGQNSPLFGSGKIFTIVHDFNSGIQYTINQSSSNCSIEEIPLGTPDAEREVKSSGSTARVRLKHAKTLLDVDPDNFVYFGERLFRGISSEVWIAEQVDPESGFYRTTEIFFSRYIWNFYIEELNIIQEVPLGIRTYSAPSKNSTQFEQIIESHYFEFNPSPRQWKDFDISTCIPENNRLYVKIRLDMKYLDLMMLDNQITQDSLRFNLARLASVSPLRITDVYFAVSRTSESSSTSLNDLDLWFVILGKPKMSSPFKNQSENNMNKNGLNLADSYSGLAKALDIEANRILRIKAGVDRRITVRIRPHSLEMSSASSHPMVRNRKNNLIRPYFFLRASYTAGSMAGLGFSMAILGICVGLFLGFLLWKRRIGLPPSYLHVSNAFPRSSSTYSQSGVTNCLIRSNSSTNDQSLSFEDNINLPLPVTPPPRY